MNTNRSTIYIHRNTPYNTISNKYFNICMKYYSDVTMNKINLSQLPFRTENMYKVDSPLYILDNEYIMDDDIDSYRQSLMFIGKCHSFIPTRNNEFRRENGFYSRDRFNINFFNDDDITYALDEFSMPCIKNTGQVNYKKVLETCFSLSSLRTMCVKSEIVIFLYYHALNLLNTKSINEMELNNVKCIIGGVARAVNSANRFEDEYISNAVYIWELTTFFNVFARLSEADEKQYSIPCHHVFRFPIRYDFIYDFGSYDLFTKYYPNIENSCDRGHISMTPKSDTDIEYERETYFYIPVTSEAVIQSTNNFNEVMNEFKNKRNLFEKANHMCNIFDYERNFIIERNDMAHDSKCFNFETVDEAVEFVKNISLPPVLHNKLVYIPLMLKQNNDCKLTYFKKISEI